METNLNWSKSPSFNAKHWFHKTWNFSTLSFSHIEEDFTNSYQPGGTLTAVMDHWTPRVMSTAQDLFGLGHWSYISLRGKQGKIVTIVSAYHISQKSSTSVGVKTAFMQQKRRIQSAFISSSLLHLTPNPNRQFILDLQVWLQDLQSQNHQIILGLDNNDDLYAAEGSVDPLPHTPNSPTRSETHSGNLRTLATAYGMVDILALHHSTRPFAPTYIRGK